MDVKPYNAPAQGKTSAAHRARRELGALWLIPELLIAAGAFLIWWFHAGFPTTFWRETLILGGILAVAYALIAWRINRLYHENVFRAEQAAQARDRLEEAAEENALLLEEAEKKTESLQTLARRVGEALSTSLDPSRIAELVLQQAIHVIHCDRAVLALRDKPSGDDQPAVFRVLAAVDSTGGSTRELIPEGSRVDYPFLETVYAANDVVFIADTAIDHRLSERERKLSAAVEIRSMMIAPMRGRDQQIMGLLILTWLHKPYKTTREEFHAADALAAQAGLAIENSRLTEELKEAQETLSHRLTLQERIAAREAAARSRIDLLLSVSQRLNASLDIGQINEIIVRGAFELAMTSCDLKQVALFRFDRETNQMTRVARFPRLKPIRGRTGHLSRPGSSAPPEQVIIAVTPGPTYLNLYVKRQPIVSDLPGDKADSAHFDLVDDLEGVDVVIRLPLVAQGEMLGHISLYAASLPDPGPRNGDGGERAALLSALSNLASLAAISLYNAQLYERVQQRAQQMTTLWTVGKAVSAHLAVDEIADTLADQVQRVLAADLCVLSLYEEGRLAPQGRQAPKSRDLLGGILPPDCECDLITREAARRRIPLAQAGIEGAGSARCRRFGRVGPHSLLAVPLIFDDETLGVLSVFRSGRQEFTQDEIDLITTLGSLSVAAIQNARSYQHEHNIAETLQTFFLTASPADVPGFEIGDRYYATSREAKIGGDYYDFIPLGGNRLAILIGDISGKGLAAAVYTAMAKYTLRAFAATPNIQPSQVVEFTNLAMAQHTSGEVFSTLFYGVLDFATNTLTYVNAGHEPPLVMRKSGSEALAPTGLVVGAVPDCVYEQEVFHFAPGDVLALYTDGLTDARSPAGVFFTSDGAADVLRKLSPTSTACEMADALYAGAREFSAGVIEDDIALLIVKVM